MDNLDFEYDGIYYHKDFEYYRHYEKYKAFKNVGISVININSYDWKNEKDTCYFRIKHILKKYDNLKNIEISCKNNYVVLKTNNINIFLVEYKVIDNTLIVNNTIKVNIKYIIENCMYLVLKSLILKIKEYTIEAQNIKIVLDNRYKLMFLDDILKLGFKPKDKLSILEYSYGKYKYYDCGRTEYELKVGDVI